MSDVTIRLLFVDEGSYHHETIRVPEGSVSGYERLIDAIREDPQILARTWVDVDRLCSAHLVDENEG